MARDPNEIELRDELEETRSRFADIPIRAKAVLGDGVDAVKNVVSDTSARIADSVPRAGDIRAGANRLSGLIRDNPIGFALGSVALGFLLGVLLPRTSIEADRMEDVKRMARDAGSQVVEAGKQMVLDTVSQTLNGRRATKHAT